MGVLGKWLLRRVIKSALAFETESRETYRRLRDRLSTPASEGARGALNSEALGHLLEEEEKHWRILEDAAAGRLDPDDLERVVQEHLYAGLDAIKPLAPEAISQWGPELENALLQEEKTFAFYDNLRRMSRIPAVRRSFEILAEMEREHAEILRRILGKRREEAPSA